MKATPEQVRQLAATIAVQARAIAEGTITGSVFVAVSRVLATAEVLQGWTPDDRQGAAGEAPRAPGGERHGLRAV